MLGRESELPRGREMIGFKGGRATREERKSAWSQSERCALMERTSGTEGGRGDGRPLHTRERRVLSSIDLSIDR